MNAMISQKCKDDAIEWALTHGMAFKATPFCATHVPFTFSPTPISQTHFAYLTHAVQLLGKLIDNVSENNALIQEVIQPITPSEPFFAALLKLHQQIHFSDVPARRVPLLIMRSDFMDDRDLGPQLIEFNGIAAGMGPFGQRVQQLHDYLQRQWQLPMGELVENHAISELANGIAYATFKIKHGFADPGSARFLMIVQDHEDNVFDQHLLELALQQRGIETHRRSFSELQGQLRTGPSHRLILDAVGTIDTVYLRAGYQYSDYVTCPSLKTDPVHAPIDDPIAQRASAEARQDNNLMAIRVFIEQHRVALNATVSQQLATSKRMQLWLSAQSEQTLTTFGLNASEANIVKSLLGEMLPITPEHIQLVKAAPLDAWVLKNQGEGGGHCLFDTDLLDKLAELDPAQSQAWALMRRIHPTPRVGQTFIARRGELHSVDDLIAEIGMFSVHFAGEPALSTCQDTEPTNTTLSTPISTPNNRTDSCRGERRSYAGYLIRSKSAKATEGGVHSGQGVLDSLMFVR